MTTETSSSTSAAVGVVDPAFSDAERYALAAFLAGYRGLTRDADALDLRQFIAWCDEHGLRLFVVRRADIECYARDLEERGRARATVTRRLCTVAGFYRYAEQEGLLERSPEVHVRRPRLDYESHATGLDRNEVGALLAPPACRRRASTRSCRCWPSTGCACLRRLALTSKRSASSAATAR